MRITSVLGLVALFLVMIGPAAPAAASDHLDPPILENDPATDIADIYAFPGATSSLGPNAVIVMTLVGHPELDVRYAFVIDSDPSDDATNGLTADATVDLWFTPNPVTTDGTPWCLNFEFGSLFVNSCADASWYDMNEEEYTIDVDLTDVLAPGCSVNCPSLQIFAGMRDDPFFFDLVAFQTFVGQLTAGSAAVCASSPPVYCSNGFFDVSTFDTVWVGTSISPFGPGTDTFADSDVYAFVVEAPGVALGSAVFSVYAATYRRASVLRTPLGDVERGPWVQIDRLAVPALSTGLITGDLEKLLYNRAPVNQSHAAELTAAIGGLRTLAAASLAAFNWTAENNFGGDRAPPTLINQVTDLVALIDPDVAHINSIPSGDDGAPAGTPDDPLYPTFPNGRTLDADVMDTVMTLLLGIPTTDGIGPPDDGCVFLTEFPYLADDECVETP